MRCHQICFAKLTAAEHQPHNGVAFLFTICQMGIVDHQNSEQSVGEGLESKAVPKGNGHMLHTQEELSS